MKAPTLRRFRKHVEGSTLREGTTPLVRTAVWCGMLSLDAVDAAFEAERDSSSSSKHPRGEGDKCVSKANKVRPSRSRPLGPSRPDPNRKERSPDLVGELPTYLGSGRTSITSFGPYELLPKARPTDRLKPDRAVKPHPANEPLSQPPQASRPDRATSRGDGGRQKSRPNGPRNKGRSASGASRHHGPSNGRGHVDRARR